MYMNDTQVFTKVKQDNEAYKDGNINNNNNNNWYNDLEFCVVENIYIVFWSELLLVPILTPKRGTFS